MLFFLQKCIFCFLKVVYLNIFSIDFVLLYFSIRLDENNFSHFHSQASILYEHQIKISEIRLIQFSYKPGRLLILLEAQLGRLR